MRLEENRETRLRRLGMRSIRRGIREMDIILSRFAEMRLAALDTEELDLYDALLSENDQDLYQWVSGQMAAPERFRPLIVQINETISVHNRAGDDRG